MSKAFTREEDDLPERSISPRESSLLPPGAKNYLTPGGAQRLREELGWLIPERTNLASSQGGDEAKRQLQMLDQRIRHLQRSLDSAVVVPPPNAADDRVRFGATVTVRERSGGESRYRIVGVDETDVGRHWVSWLSPIARALLNAQLGQRVRFRLPSGDEELEIVRVIYE